LKVGPEAAIRALDVRACDLRCAAPRFRHIEWFHDHVRIEQMLFDGAPEAHDDAIAPVASRPGLGLASKRRDAERLAVRGGTGE
jgi:hypothetical protein